jgi:hypothetical protein
VHPLPLHNLGSYHIEANSDGEDYERRYVPLPEK